MSSATCPSPEVRPPAFRRADCWLQVVSHLDTKFGGIASSLPLFCTASEAAGIMSPLIAFCNSQEYRANWFETRGGVSLVPPGRLRWLLDWKLGQSLKEMIRNTDGVHIHGIWETHCATTARLATACKRPYIVSAHGMLDRWALRQKRFKKALYATLIESGNLRNAACLRALTTTEVADYRRIGLTNPIAVVPGAISMPPQARPDLFFESHPELRGRRLMLFLGRLHQKKGLEMLVRAWSAVRSRDAHLVIAGPDSDGTLENIERLVSELGVGDRVTFCGMLAGAAKWSALAAASLFVLPSFSEGFSVAVLEALGMGIPVIVTRPCNLPEVAETGCGWITEPEQSRLEEALREALDLPDSDLARMGEAGKRLVESRFIWPVVSHQMAEVYRWIQGGPRPATLDLV